MILTYALFCLLVLGAFHDLIAGGVRRRGANDWWYYHKPQRDVFDHDNRNPPVYALSRKWGYARGSVGNLRRDSLYEVRSERSMRRRRASIGIVGSTISAHLLMHHSFSVGHKYVSTKLYAVLGGIIQRLIPAQQYILKSRETRNCRWDDLGISKYWCPLIPDYFSTFLFKPKRSGLTFEEFLPFSKCFRQASAITLLYRLMWLQRQEPRCGVGRKYYPAST